MSIADEDSPKRTTSYEIGADLSRLSVAELETLLIRLGQEMERIKAAIDTKKALAGAAETFFKR